MGRWVFQAVSPSRSYLTRKAASPPPVPPCPSISNNTYLTGACQWLVKLCVVADFVSTPEAALFHFQFSTSIVAKHECVCVGGWGDGSWEHGHVRAPVLHSHSFITPALGSPNTSELQRMEVVTLCQSDQLFPLPNRTAPSGQEQVEVEPSAAQTVDPTVE